MDSNTGRASISLSQITALVSGSGRGRSNLMSAIAFAARFISAGSRTRLRMTGRLMRAHEQKKRRKGFPGGFPPPHGKHGNRLLCGLRIFL